MSEIKIHKLAIVDDGALVGQGTSVWANAHICSKAIIGENCNIGQNAYVDNYAIVGNNCKLQNNVNVYDGVTLEDYVFCGPSMTFTNVSIPRCEFPHERDSEYYLKTHVGRGASLGGQCVVVCGHNIGEYALVGSGAVVCHDVPSHALVVGNPAKQIAWVCRCGHKLNDDLFCPTCGRAYKRADNLGLEEINGE